MLDTHKQLVQAMLKRINPNVEIKRMEVTDLDSQGFSNVF